MKVQLATSTVTCFVDKEGALTRRRCSLETRPEGGLVSRVVSVMVKVVFICKGTRGDVHPVLSIALAFKNSHVTDEVVFVCTSSSIAGFVHLADKGLTCITSLPDITVSSDSAKLQLLKHEASICYKACSGAKLIVFNLFSLEGYFIAQELSIPCIAVSPFLLTRTPPSGFKEQLSQAFPDLFKSLTLSSDSNNTVSYAEVDHWMWRLFLDDYGSVCEHLGFSSNTPFIGSTLPLPTPLLYGLSSVLSPRQSYWPKSVQLCGYWFPPPALQCSVPPELITVVDSVTKPLVYIGFGSMEKFMVDVDWRTLLNVIDSALKLVQMKGMFQCIEGGTVQEAYHQLSTKFMNLNLWTKEASHQWLFPKCVAILHHGGSGTVATALFAKRPQLISPVMFDQEHWAEVVEWKNLGARLSPASSLTVEELSAKLKLVCSLATAENIELAHREIIKDDGIKKVITEIEKALC